MNVSFFVPGIPAPGGSKRGFAYKGKMDGKTHVAIVDSAGQRVKDWRATVALTASEAFSPPPLSNCPIWVRLDFILQRPKSHLGTGNNSAILKESAPEYHLIKCDASKYARSTEDALTGILWHDDCQVVDIRSTKRWGERPGCHISISTEGQLNDD